MSLKMTFPLYYFLYLLTVQAVCCVNHTFFYLMTTWNYFFIVPHQIIVLLKFVYLWPKTQVCHFASQNFITISSLDKSATDLYNCIIFSPMLNPNLYIKSIYCRALKTLSFIKRVSTEWVSFCVEGLCLFFR